ncbi:host attachment protein [Palleronia sediminis]|uniref:Host attachment protein n=1 Tax=Palleronia sediminis TaxID=2547833 RepID=A0A4R6A399_9RHOB|nr:host attachment family protein [Palleronia sediminis]TDL78060.1 host attachment protein [Palleronia sediminis]
MSAKLTQGTWVLIADGEKALILENKTDHENPYLAVLSTKEQDNPSARAQATDRPGRFNDGPSVHRSAVQDTDWHELAKDRFADDLAEMLYNKAQKGAFERIVLVASHGVLGEMRGKLHHEVERRVVAEIPKTLTNHSLDDIEKVVKASLAEG